LDTSIGPISADQIYFDTGPLNTDGGPVTLSNISNLTFQARVSDVPLPGTLGLFGLGLAGLGFARRKKS
jgi:hypothetical protein